jgi:hypothetical protein
VNLTFNGSSSLVRNSTAAMNLGGTTVVTFNDNSSLRSSRLPVTDGVTLNWNSAGSWTSVGAAANPNFVTTVGVGSQVINMSAGLWSLVGNSAVDSIIMSSGTFNLTGGTIFNEDRFRMDTSARFNLGGTGSLYMSTDFLTGSVKFNFVGTDSAYYTKANNLPSRIASGFIYIDDVLQTDASRFNFQTVAVDESLFGGTGGTSVTYTRITVVPEPSTIGLAALGLTAAALVGRRARQES